MRARPARPEDAAAVAEIYSQGIEDRIATFETEPRSEADILPWFAHALAFVTVEDEQAGIIAWAAVHPYSTRPCYRGVGEFSVYVRRNQRGRGVGETAMAALVEAARAEGLWKLTSRIFPENRASLALMTRMGFREVGVLKKHGRLDGVWKDCVIVERLIAENLE